MPQQSFNYGGDIYDYSVFHIPERQEKIAIHVFPNGAIQIDAPAEANTSEIKKAVIKRARWISTHVSEAKGRLEHILPREYVSGESHYYLGRRYLLKVLQGNEAAHSVKLLRGKLEVTCGTPDISIVSALLSTWYRTHAIKIFNARLQTMSSKISWLNEIPDMKLRSMKKQWGSCSPSGNIILNPHLVKASRDCIDYVILHELCHLKEHNHSPRFYKELDRSMPNWRSVKGRLDGMAETILAV